MSESAERPQLSSTNTPESKADALLSRVHEAVKITNRNILVLAGSLLLIWLNFLPLQTETLKALALSKSLSISQANLGTSIEDITKKRDKSQNDLQNLSRIVGINHDSEKIKNQRIAALKEVEASKSAVQDLLKNKSINDKKLSDSVKAISIDFKVAGYDANIYPAYAPIARLALFLSLLVYFFHKRSKIIVTYSKILRLQQSMGKSSAQEVDDVMSEAPFWLSPFSAQSGRQSLVLCIIMWAILGIFCLHVAFIEFSVLRVFMQTDGIWLPLPTATAILVLAAIGVCFSWFRISKLPDDNPFYTPKNGLTRREVAGFLVLSSLGLTTLSTSLYAGVIKKPAHLYFSKPAKNFTKTSRSPGFYINAASNVVHYVTKDSKIRYADNKLKHGLKPYVFPDLEDSWLVDLSQPHVNFKTASFAFEQQALLCLDKGDSDGAFHNLFAGIFHDTKHRRILEGRIKANTKNELEESADVRLYDLLAGLSVRLHRKEDFLRLIRTIRENSPPNVLLERQKKWLNENSSWRKRWIESKEIPWNRRISERIEIARR